MMLRWSSLAAYLFSAASLIFAFAGCSSAGARFVIRDYQDPVNIRRYTTAFDEAYYNRDPAGNIDLILIARSDEAGEPEVSQIVHVRTVWRCIPSQTIANDTQVNGTITYAVLAGGVSTTYEGAGSVFFHADPLAKERITGSIDLAVLQPQRQLAPTEPIFKRLEISGKFAAQNDPRRTVREMNDLARMFGPRGEVAQN